MKIKVYLDKESRVITAMELKKVVLDEELPEGTLIVEDAVQTFEVDVPDDFKFTSENLFSEVRKKIKSPGY